MNNNFIFLNPVDNILISAKEKTDFFIDNLNNYKMNDMPFHYVNADNDFDITCSIRADFKETYDAGAIFIYENDSKWIKAAYELTDLGYPSIVSVVTNNVSDDCNGEKVLTNNIWLKVLRKKEYFSIHYSIDGNIWFMVRYFSLNLSKKVKIGFAAQSPLGEGCTVVFSNISISDNKYNNIRNLSID